MTDQGREIQDIIHHCDRNARYHAARRAFLDKWHRTLMVVVLLSGSAAVALLNEALGVNDTVVLTVTMLIPTLIGAFSAVWNLTSRARDHEILARRFYQVYRSVETEQASPKRIRSWKSEILGIYEDEPAVYHALNAECYNAVTRARYSKPSQLQRVKWYHHVLRNWLHFSAKEFPVEEVDEPS